MITGAALVTGFTQVIKKTFGSSRYTLLVVFLLSICVAFLVELRDADTIKNLYVTVINGIEYFFAAVGIHSVGKVTEKKIERTFEPIDTIDFSLSE